MESNNQVLFQRALEKLELHLVEKKLRRTPERNDILKLIYLQDRHLDTESIYLALIDKGIKLSKATVYNSLELFLELGLVLKHYLSNQVAVYEKAIGQKQHDHFYCTQCKKIIEFCDPRIQMILSSIEENLQVKISKHNLYLQGVCLDDRCAKF